MKEIGPRICYLTLGSTEEELQIFIRSEENSNFEAQDAASYIAEARVVSNKRFQTFKAYAGDEILAVGRMTMLVGSYLLGECERSGAKLSTLDRSEVRTPMELF